MGNIGKFIRRELAEMFLPFFFFTSFRSMVVFVTGLAFILILSVALGEDIIRSLLSGAFMVRNTFWDYIAMGLFAVETVFFALMFWALIDSMTI